jgi:hypothetical protein
LKLKSSAMIFFSIGLALALCTGCGRKLPPMPPGKADPVEILSIDFAGDGSVEAKARCNIEGARLILLGKPKGICPSCVDDLKKKDEKPSVEKGTVVLKDPKPEAEYMIYRIDLEKGTTSFMTGARVVRK